MKTSRILMVLGVVVAGIFIANYLIAAMSPKPRIENLVIDFGNPPDDFGDFLEEDFLSGEKPFLEFGAVVDEGKILPTFEYRVRKDARVYAPSSGYVSMIKHQPETDDYEIIISPSRFSPWFVSVDHVRNITVKEWDYVRAGQFLGYPGPWDERHGRVELMVGINMRGKSIDYCPLELMEERVKKKYIEKVRAFIDYWNSVSERKYYTPYLPGCVERAYIEDHEKGVVGKA